MVQPPRRGDESAGDPNDRDTVGATDMATDDEIEERYDQIAEPRTSNDNLSADK